MKQSFIKLIGIIRKSVFIALITATGFVFITVASTKAQSGGGTADVRPDPPTLEVGQGQVETLNIVIENAKDVYGIDVRGKFDPSVIEVVDADPSKDGVQMIPGDFIKPDFLVRNTVDNQKGTFQYVITQVNPTLPVTGSGIVVSMLVRGKVLGKKAALVIDYIQTADRQGRKLPVQPKNGTVSIVQPKPPTSTPTLQATPTVAVTATQMLSPTPTETLDQSAAETTPTTSNGNSLVDALLVLIALGGCFGAVVIIAIAAFVILRRPARAAKPNAQRNLFQTNGT